MPPAGLEPAKPSKPAAVGPRLRPLCHLILFVITKTVVKSFDCRSLLSRGRWWEIRLQGLSGKFPDVQNSPPLRWLSGARQVLLSSNEFGELRRENRIARSCLVIVLCFFVWSQVRRVWRFSRDKKMCVFHEQRICVKIGKSVTETFEMLKIAFREEGLKRKSGGNVSKRAELRLIMIRVRDGHQRRKVTIMLQKFVKSSVQIVVWQF
jgi:hypothetical protein